MTRPASDRTSRLAMSGTAVHRDRIRFDYWSDPLCIWACVGQKRLDDLMVDRAGVLKAWHRVVIVFDSVPWRFEKGPWKDDGPRGRVEATRNIAMRFGREDIDGSIWMRDPPASSWGPGAAVRAAYLAEEQGAAERLTGVTYERTLRERMFVDNLNIARREVQLETAEASGIAPAILEQRLQDGSAMAALAEDQRLKQSLGIQGSPTYVFDNGRAILYGNFPLGILHATVDELVRSELVSYS